MYHEIETLLILQDRDQKIRELKKDLERIPLEEAAARSRVEGEKKAVAAAKHAVQENEVALKKLELDVDTRNQSIARLKIQQYETRKNEEYRALGEEVERYESEISGLEDKELELMEHADELKAKLAAANEALDHGQKVVEDELAQYAKRRENFEKQLAELEQERTGLAAKVEPDTLNIYDRLMHSKGGTAVVPLENGQCGGCHMKVIKSLEVEVKAQKGLVHCLNCSRILYLH